MNSYRELETPTVLPDPDPYDINWTFPNQSE